MFGYLFLVAIQANDLQGGGADTLSMHRKGDNPRGTLYNPFKILRYPETSRAVGTFSCMDKGSAWGVLHGESLDPTLIIPKHIHSARLRPKVCGES